VGGIFAFITVLLSVVGLSIGIKNLIKRHQQPHPDNPLSHYVLGLKKSSEEKQEPDPFDPQYQHSTITDKQIDMIFEKQDIDTEYVLVLKKLRQYCLTRKSLPVSMSQLHDLTHLPQHKIREAIKFWEHKCVITVYRAPPRANQYEVNHRALYQFM